MKLTLPQQDVYYEQLMYPHLPIYNIGAKISIKGPLVYDALNKAYNALINQHDSYRSYLVSEGDVVSVLVEDHFQGTLEYMDFSAKANADEAANSYMQEAFKIPFLLQESKQLHHFILIKIKEDFHYLFSVYHHIITDGWATSLMFQRLVKNYNELLENGKIVSEYPFSYQAFVEADANYFSSESYQKDKAYWKDKFQQLPEQLFEKTKGKEALPESRRKAIQLERSVYDQLEKLGKAAGCSTFHVILGILFLYFSRKQQHKDFAIGLPVLNRGKFIFKKTVGLFMGIALFRIQMEEDFTFSELIKSIKKELRADYRHQQFPLGKLIKELGLFGERERLFNITLSYEKQNYADHFQNTQTAVSPLSHQSERVALAIYIREFDKSEEVTLDFDYNVNYFSEEEITKVTTHFQKLLTAVLKTPELPLHEYEYLSEAEKDFLLHELNNTQKDYSATPTLLNLIKQQANLHPDTLVLEDETKKYSYAQLESLSDALANYLESISEKDRSPIAVLMDRSADLVVTLLGVLKSGRAYIPLDPSFPKDRLSYILAHSGVQQIIGNKNLKNKNWTNTSFIDLETILNDPNKNTTKIDKSRPESTAYIIYTSGSTGQPKGVAIGHAALLNFLMSMQETPGLNASDKLFSVTTQSFDISGLEFFTPLISGARLYIASQDLLSDPLAVVEKIAAIHPSILQATPSFYQMLYHAGWNGNAAIKILCGGDLLSEALAAKLLATNQELWNMYGPTETTIWSTCKKIQKATEASTIGKPIHNTQIYILGDQLELLPLGCVGEIYIGGDGLAQGYYKNKELTEERFLENPFAPASKIYRTGDLGKWKENGELEFLGRNDHQVKIRGYRIELGEIETRLNQLEEIKEAVVIAKKEEGQEAVLVAYLRSEKTISDDSKILKALQKDLPEYMIPYKLVSLDEFPLTANKKVDRKALSLRAMARPKKSIKKPTSDLEKTLQTYFKEVLGSTGEISIEDNFFSLGGHSLAAVKLINKINQQLQRRLSLKDIFENPSIQKLASHVASKAMNQAIEIPLLEKQEHYEVTPSQYQIWLASQQEEKSAAYNMTGVYKIAGQLDKGILEEVLSAIVDRHEILRTRFVVVDGLPRQKIISAEKVNSAIEELYVERTEVSSTLQSFSNIPFDLEKGDLLKIALVYVENKASFLLFKTHHIIIDGWSIEVLIKEVLDQYQIKQRGGQVEDVKLPFQFKEYASWYLNEIQKGAERNTLFWTNYLQDYNWRNIIPRDFENFQDLNTGETMIKAFSEIGHEKLNPFLQLNQISLHTFLVAAFNLLVSKMYGHEELCIGTINAGRTSVDIEKHLGMFAKTLPFRTPIKSDQLILERLHHIQDNLLKINEHQNIPASISNTLRIDTLIVLQNASMSYDQIKIGEDLSLEQYRVNSSYSRLPFLLNIKVEKNELTVEANYNTGYYEAATVEVLLLKYEKILLAILENSNQTLEQINIDLEIEKQATIAIDFDF